MGVPASFQNAPSGLSTYWGDFTEFDNSLDIARFDWYTDGNAGGHDAPYTVNNVDGGSVTLGSGSTNSGSYVQAQESGFNVLPTRLSKTYLFLWNFSLSSATLTEALLGCCSQNSNLMGTNIVNGFGAYANLTGGLSATNWTFFLATASTTQFSTYTQLPGPVVDTLTHTFGIKYITDPNTLGAGQMTFWWDGVQIGNGISSTVAAFPQNPMAMSAAMGNGSAAAQSMLLTGLGVCGQR